MYAYAKISGRYKLYANKMEINIDEGKQCYVTILNKTMNILFLAYQEWRRCRMD